jgi:hypothetical protein
MVFSRMQLCANTLCVLTSTCIECVLNECVYTQLWHTHVCVQLCTKFSTMVPAAHAAAEPAIGPWIGRRFRSLSRTHFQKDFMFSSMYSWLLPYYRYSCIHTRVDCTKFSTVDLRCNQVARTGNRILVWRVPRYHGMYTAVLVQVTLWGLGRMRGRVLFIHICTAVF